ncbi:hypothetical protein IV203_009983 [Nitzschia inconspicua]|uniref:Uncharacterized protein n=1 Tax=Nitzschia inconspicua TaxID=303405 RepID=A0A9K3PKJ9_9STRA|nr:hypothetical protein IV203_009983 [Nitzschia inconspicua]
MSTPTNHTSITSFFNECEPGPEESQISLDSSIEDSNIFEHSAHSRYSAFSNHIILGRARAASGGQSLLGPLEEEQEGSEVHTTPSISISNNSSDAENNFVTSNIKTDIATPTTSSRNRNKKDNTNGTNHNNGGGILKTTRFSDGSCSTLPPPPPPPSNTCPITKGNKQQQQQQPIFKLAAPQPEQSSEKQQKRDEIPVLSVTKVLANAKSEETDSAFLTFFSNTTNTATNSVNPAATVPEISLAADPSQRTNATFGMIPGNVPSETLHTSNLRLNTDGGFQAREAERMAAWAIHIALIFFCGLVVASVLISFTVIRKYGFVALLGLMMMLVFVGFLAVFVDQTILSKNPNLRPIRQKIAAAVEATKGLLVEEYHLLIRDWNEHLLLTQGEERYRENAEINQYRRNGALPPPSVPHGRKRSKIFKLVKPFLGLKKKIFHGRQRRNQQQQQPSAGVVAPETNTPSSVSLHLQSQDYQPPVATTTGVMT